ncbi:hypothetical protein LOK49_LG05G02809 [Camellia lanceoleosa]|uniref:Uncharacterized protein n=1 Tax=Camellia lanceoleosa TaxID=1840588 RepID=A0ACC0HQW9_9ERIC|nr:hypothetical protein LOK49_LG05G02809 [Camellia lanceoleosa]
MLLVLGFWQNKVIFLLLQERQSRVAIVVKAIGESSESSISLSIVKSWDNSEDRLALIRLGFAAVVAVWASANLITVLAPILMLLIFME